MFCTLPESLKAWKPPNDALCCVLFSSGGHTLKSPHRCIAMPPFIDVETSGLQSVRHQLEGLIMSAKFLTIALIAAGSAPHSPVLAQ